MNPSKYQHIRDIIDMLPKGKEGNLQVLPYGARKWSVDTYLEKTDVASLQKINGWGSFFSINNQELSEGKLTFTWEFSTNDDFFIDIEDFKKNILDLESIPEEFYILGLRLYQSPDKALPKNIEIYQDRLKNISCILQILTEHAHHSEPSQGYMIYVDPESEDGDTKSIKLINKTRDLSLFHELLDQDIALNSLSSLKIRADDDQTLSDSSYSARERVILRNTITSFIPKSESNIHHNRFNKSVAAENTKFLLLNSDDFDKKFEANLHIYIKDISFDKLKSELTQEQMKLFEALHKGLQDVTNRVLILPGVTLLITFIRSSGKPTEEISSGVSASILLIFILITTALVIMSSIRSQETYINTIDSFKNISRQKIDRLTDELQSSIQESFTFLDEGIDNAKNTLTAYTLALFIVPTLFLCIFDSTSSATLYFGVFLVFFAIINPREYIKHFFSRTRSLFTRMFTR